MRFADLRTVHKLALGFGALLLAVVVVGWVGIRGFQRTGHNLDVLYHQDMANAVDIRRAQAESIRMGRCARAALLEPEDKIISKEISHVEKSDKIVLELLDHIESRMSSADDKAKLADARTAHSEYTSSMRAILGMAKEPAKWRPALTATAPIVTRFEEAVSGIDEGEGRLAQERFESSVNESRQALTTEAALVVASILLCLLGTAVIGRAIARPLGRAEEVLRGVAKGDFTVELQMETADEIGRMAAAVDEAIDGMRRALREVRGVAGDVATAARQLSETSQEMSNGAQDQAASLEETAATLEQITSTANQNTQSAEHAAKLAATSRDVAEKGGRAVDSVITSMDDITIASKKISDVVATIDEFAFQTNLLALNAAIEAARAGEHGRGFAVVAGEVRSLAQRSARAATEIKSLVGDALTKVQAGSNQVTASGAMLREIVASVRTVTERVSEIAAASREQLSGVSQVNQAMTRMDGVTQGNSSRTEELASTARTLAGQAEQLNRLVAMFRLGEDPAAAPRVAAVARPTRHRAPPALGAGRPRPMPASPRNGRPKPQELDEF